MEASEEEKEYRYVFVYGTLKDGFYNYNKYLKHAVDSQRASFFAQGRTEEPVRMVIAEERCVPMLLSVDETNGQQVGGEVYRLNEMAVLDGLDELEGVSLDYYYRRLTPIRIRSEETIMCWVYFMKTVDESLLLLPIVADYTLKEHENYAPKISQVSPSIMTSMTGIDY